MIVHADIFDIVINFVGWINSIFLLKLRFST